LFSNGRPGELGHLGRDKQYHLGRNWRKERVVLQWKAMMDLLVVRLMVLLGELRLLILGVREVFIFQGFPESHNLSALLPDHFFNLLFSSMMAKASSPTSSWGRGKAFLLCLSVAYLPG
jgi:hypothetical protein